MDRFLYIDKDTCACGASLSESVGIVRKQHSWGEVRFLRCPVCFSWNQSPQIAIESLVRWYNSDQYQAAAGTKSGEGIYLDYEAGEQQRQAEALIRYRRDLSKLFSSPGEVLEVGCASGSQLAVMRAMGWDISGIDLSKRFAEMADRVNNIDVTGGDFLDFDCRSNPLDAIIMLGTVSNLQNYTAHLAHVRKNLRPGGIFYFNFPVAGSLISHLYGKRYWMFTPSVATFFSLKGMHAALKTAGFEEIHFHQDWQRPSIAKILSQAKLSLIYRGLSRFGGASFGLPFPVPIPGVTVG